MAVIALTRETATRGNEVASGLARRLGLTVVDDELFEHDIADRSGWRESEVHRYLEGSASLMERLKLDRTRLSRCTAQEVLELASRGNVLIRGWGGTYLLQSIAHVVCVRIYAPMSYRETVMMERLGLDSASKAKREIERSDATHNGTMQKLFGLNWEDPSQYAIALNTARVAVADCVEHIVRTAESPAFRETIRSRSALKDLVIQARVQQALDQRFGSRSIQNGMEANVFNGKVLLTGATTDEFMVVEALRLIQGIEGVSGVESKVAHVAFVPHAY